VADKRFYVKKNRITCFDFFGVAIQIRGMERYKLLVNSVCLRCRRWLCV